MSITKINWSTIPPANGSKLAENAGYRVVENWQIYVGQPRLSFMMREVPNVAPFASADILHFAGCSHLYDVSALAGVRELRFFMCPNITGIEALTRPHPITGKISEILEISHNQSITDVTMFANVRDLSIHGCREFTDVSALANVKMLNLADTSITDVSALGNVQLLDLSRTEVADVSALGNVDQLYLCDCDEITDVSALANVRELFITGCIGIEDVSMLTGVKILHVSGVVDTSMLPASVKVVREE